MFDKKPVIQKWTADLDVRKIDVSIVLVWVRMIDLKLKY